MLVVIFFSVADNCQLNISRSSAHQSRLPGTSKILFHNFCHSCCIGFDDPFNFQQHMVAVHARPMPYMCSQCGRCYGSNTGLKHHTRLHDGKVYVCPVCDVSFSQTSSMKRHLKTAHSSKQCVTCQGIFKIGEDYNTHVLNCKCSLKGSLFEESFDLNKGLNNF